MTTATSKWVQTDVRDYVHNLPAYDLVFETDPKIVEYYLDLIASHFGNKLESAPLWVHRDYKMLAVQKVQRKEQEYYEFFLQGGIIHLFIAYPLETILELAPDFAELCEATDVKTFLPKPFTTLDHSYAMPIVDGADPRVAFMDSPSVSLLDAYGNPHTLESYQQSLQTKRRYKFNRAVIDFKDTSTEVVSQLTDEHMDWLVDQTKKCWDTDECRVDVAYVYYHALIQILWGVSVTYYKPDHVRWFICRNNIGQILAIVSFVQRRECFFFNSFTRSTDLPDQCQNIGTFMLTQVVTYFLLNPVKDVTHLESTIATSYLNEAFNVYKRTVCNAGGSKPSIAICAPGWCANYELVGKVYENGWINISTDSPAITT